VFVDDEVVLGKALHALTTDADLRDAFGRRSLELSEGFRPEAWAAAVAAFASATVEARSATRRSAD